MIAAQLSDAGISLVSPLAPSSGPAATGSENGPFAEQNLQWNQITADLLRLRQLEDDWDGQGASAPAPDNVESALEWVRQMRSFTQAIPPSQVVPGVTGEVLLVWQRESFFLEAEICQPGRVEWMLAVTGLPTKHWVTDSPCFVGSVC